MSWCYGSRACVDSGGGLVCVRDSKRHEANGDAGFKLEIPSPEPPDVQHRRSRQNYANVAIIFRAGAWVLMKPVGWAL